MNNDLNKILSKLSSQTQFQEMNRTIREACRTYLEQEHRLTSQRNNETGLHTKKAICSPELNVCQQTHVKSVHANPSTSELTTAIHQSEEHDNTCAHCDQHIHNAEFIVCVSCEQKLHYSCQNLTADQY